MINNKESEFSKDDFKRILIETFKFTIDFLNRHNLRWFVGGGTCIGTIRHKGLIPWDDDIDLFMPREDYDRLVCLRKELTGSSYELISWETSDQMIPFAKIINRNTTIWEIKYHPYPSGVFIDIFPMEFSAKDRESIMKDLRRYDCLLRRYRASMASYTWKDIILLGVKRRFYFFREGILSKFTHSHKNEYLNKLQEIEKDNNKKGGNYYVLFSASFAYAYEKEVLKKEWFDDYVLMPFEDVEVRVPVGYDDYLRHVYGDYMQLPPEEKRVTRHFHYYVNLKEGKTIEEIREIKLKENKAE